MRILIANDKFKGSLPAEKAGFHIKNSLETTFPQASFDLCPIADGGEGTALAMTTALAGEWTRGTTQDAQGRPLEAPFGWVASSATAIMEMSAASGLAIVQDLKLNPFTASTLGTGILIQSALTKGARRILIGIGGSATNDGGLGVAIALGYTFKKAGHAFTPTLETILEADQVEKPASLPACELIVACDVDNPLLGPRGATSTAHRKASRISSGSNSGSHTSPTSCDATSATIHAKYLAPAPRVDSASVSWLSWADVSSAASTWSRRRSDSKPASSPPTSSSPAKADSMNKACKAKAPSASPDLRGVSARRSSASPARSTTQPHCARSSTY